MTETKNAVIGQSGGPTAAINATLAGVIAGCLDENASIDRIYGMRHGIEGFMRRACGAKQPLCQKPRRRPAAFILNTGSRARLLPREADRRKAVRENFHGA